MDSYRTLVLLALACAFVGIPAQAQENVAIDHTQVVAQLSGQQSINQTTTKFGVSGADLGHGFVYDDKVYMILGDTFGVGKSDWRSNVAAIISDDDPSDGLTFDRMIEDAPGHAKELLSSKKVDGDEITVIPTYGIAIGDRLYLHRYPLMQVNRKCRAGNSWIQRGAG